MKREKLLITGAEWFLRLTLAAGFLSAVADRFGLWGPPSAPGVAWGNWTTFLDYVGTLNGYAPPSLIPVLGWIATVAEVVIALGLIIGWRLRWFALGAGVLLFSFAVAMAGAHGVKEPLDASVFVAAAGAFLLAAVHSAQSQIRAEGGKKLSREYSFSAEDAVE